MISLSGGCKKAKCNRTLLHSYSPKPTTTAPPHHQEVTVSSQASAETCLKQSVPLFILNCLQKKSTEHQQDFQRYNGP